MSPMNRLACQCFAILLMLVLFSPAYSQEPVPSWTSIDGKTIKAEFLRLEGRALVIRKDSRQFKVPLSRLSEASREQAQAMAKTIQSANPALSREELAMLWDKLLPKPPVTTKSRLESIRALLKLAKTPESLTDFSALKLKPVKLTRAELLALLESLGSDNEAEWQTAYNRLRVCDPTLFIGIEQLYALPQVQEYPARHRLADLTHGLSVEYLADSPLSLTYRKEPIAIVSVEGELRLTFKRRGPSGQTFEGYWTFSKDEQVTPESLRLAMALMLLASFDTPNAGKVILPVASGHPKAMLTRIARSLIEERRQPSSKPQLPDLWDALRRRSALQRDHFELWDFDRRVSNDLAAAYAVTGLLANPAATTQMLSERLQPAEMSPDEFESLLGQLASEEETQWRKAFDKLHVFNRTWKFEEIESLLARTQFQDYPARHRLVDLITCTPLSSYRAASRGAGRYKFVTIVENPDENGPRYSIKCGPDDKFRGTSPVYWAGGAEREAIALLILDSLSHRPAKELIELIATGDPRAGITKFAQSILDNRQPD